MSTLERVFHSVLFEVLAVALSICGLDDIYRSRCEYLIRNHDSCRNHRDDVELLFQSHF